jgi:hypothetical protein
LAVDFIAVGITHFGALPFMVVDFMVVGLLTMAGVIIEDTTTEVSTIIEGITIAEEVFHIALAEEVVTLPILEELI